jgi:hypothetical protein
MYEVPYLSVRTLPPRYDPVSATFTFATCPPEPVHKQAEDRHEHADDRHEQAGDVGVDDLRFLVVQDTRWKCQLLSSLSKAG